MADSFAADLMIGVLSLPDEKFQAPRLHRRGRALISHLHGCPSRARYAKIHRSPRCQAVELQAR